ncbi:hypothetical protein DSECCO2_474800 [anaerobic digester metagenome]
MSDGKTTKKFSQIEKLILISLARNDPKEINLEVLQIYIQDLLNFQIPKDFYQTIPKSLIRLEEEELIQINEEDKVNFQKMKEGSEWLWLRMRIRLTDLGKTESFYLQFESVKNLQRDIEDAHNKIRQSSEELKANQLTMIEILGIFTAVLALIFTGIQTIPSDKLPTDPWDTFVYVSAVIAPFGIIILLLIIMIWLITRVRKTNINLKGLFVFNKEKK